MRDCSTKLSENLLASARAGDEHALQGKPPSDNMGVKNSGGCAESVTFHVDYLRVTAWMDRAEFENLYDLTIGGDLGSWVKLGHGGRFYTQVEEAHLGARLYTLPAVEYADPKQITVELPGKACSLLGWVALQNFYIQLAIHSVRPVRVPRLDLAFDNAPFTVKEFGEAVLAGDCRTYARRETMREMNNPFEKREDGQEGCHTFYVGDRQSRRMLRVYDKHGGTRVELELHDEKAAQVAKHLLEDGVDPEWQGLEEEAVIFSRSMGHLRDFIDIAREWWDAFVNGVERAYMKLTGVTAQELDASSIASYLIKQVSAAFSVAVDVYGLQFAQALLTFGRVKREGNKKYQLVLT